MILRRTPSDSDCEARPGPRRADHDGLEVPGQADRVDDFGHLGGDFCLGTVVPVRLLDGVSLIETEGTSRLVRPLLSRLRIVRRLDHALDLEVGEHVVAVVLQEKGLRPSLTRTMPS